LRAQHLDRAADFYLGVRPRPRPTRSSEWLGTELRERSERRRALWAVGRALHPKADRAADRAGTAAPLAAVLEARMSMNLLLVIIVAYLLIGFAISVVWLLGDANASDKTIVGVYLFWPVPVAVLLFCVLLAAIIGGGRRAPTPPPTNQRKPAPPPAPPEPRPRW
jgi:hypothetical protein